MVILRKKQVFGTGEEGFHVLYIIRASAASVWVGRLFQICVGGCCCLLSLFLDRHLSWVYIPVKRIQLVLCDADFVWSRNMLCLFSSAYKGFSVAVFVVWRGLYALLVSSSQFEVEVYVKCVVRDCCRAEREVSLFCR